MKKRIGLAMLPVLLAVSPMLAMAKQTQPQQAQHPVAQAQQQPVAEQEQSSDKPVPGHAQKKSEKHRAKSGKTVVPQANAQDMAPLSSEAEIRQQMLEAHKSLVNRQYQAAVNGFQRVITAQPNNVTALHEFGLSLYSHGRPDEALKIVNQAIAIDPLSDRLFFLKGHILEAQNKPVEAVEAYLTFTAMDPQDGAALLAHRRINDLFKVVTPQLNQAQKTYFDGLYMLSLQQHEEALPLFQEYQAMEPNNPQANLFIGQAYLQLGQPDKALAHLENVLKLQSDNPLAYYRLGSVYEMQGEMDSAREAYRKLLQIAPQSQTAQVIHRRIGLQ